MVAPPQLPLAMSCSRSNWTSTMNSRLPYQTSGIESPPCLDESSERIESTSMTALGTTQVTSYGSPAVPNCADLKAA